MSNKRKTIAPLGFSAEAGIGLPQSRQTVSKVGARYLPFSSNSNRYNANNLYPQQLADLAFNAPTNGAAITMKQMLTVGQGFNINEFTRPIRNFCNCVNSFNESLNDILDRVAWDYSMFNGFALKVKWNGNGKVVSIEHIPFTDVRVGVPNEDGRIEHYVVSNNWDHTLAASLEKTYAIRSFNPEVWSEGVADDEDGIPAPTEDQLENAEQLIYYWKYKPIATNGQRWYPFPDYGSALDSIMTEKDICIANKSKIDNGIGGKYMVTFPYLPQTEEEQKEINDSFYRNFSGADNDGKVINFYVDGQENVPKVDKLDPLAPEAYVELEKSVKQNIITAHNIPAILVEYNFGGGFNNRAEEMEVALKQFQSTTIKAYQNAIVTVFDTLLSYAGYEVDLAIIPFSLDPTQQVQGETSLEN